MKINYDLKFQEELQKIKGTRPTLLLHVCCGPCSGNVIKEIADIFDITIYYSNSNIYPNDEYQRRYQELLTFIDQFNLDFNHHIKVICLKNILKKLLFTKMNLKEVNVVIFVIKKGCLELLIMPLKINSNIGLRY